MINYLSITSRAGKRSLTILNTEAQDIAPQIEAAASVRNVGEILKENPAVRVAVVKRSYREQPGEGVEVLIGGAIARREAWTLYDSAGEVVGSGSGDWGNWYVNSLLVLVDNGVLALAALRELEALRLQGGNLEPGQLIVEEVHGGDSRGGFPIKASHYAVAEGVTGVEITSAEPCECERLGLSVANE